jgi:hypothetical protein
MKRLLLCASLFFLPFVITSCSTKHQVITKPTEKPALTLKDPEPLELDKVKFTIVFDDNGEPLFALSEQDYKNLASNTDQIKNYILLQKKIIKLYRDYYEPRD